jgi:hypothetical protein
VYGLVNFATVKMNCADVIMNDEQIKVKMSTNENILTEKSEAKSTVRKSFYQGQGAGTKEEISADQ